MPARYFRCSKCGSSPAYMADGTVALRRKAGARQGRKGVPLGQAEAPENLVGRTRFGPCYAIVCCSAIPSNDVA